VLALELAEHADVVRAVTVINASEDAYYFDRLQTRPFTDRDDVDPKYLYSAYSPRKPRAPSLKPEARVRL
jgi:hypothetical protein